VRRFLGKHARRLELALALLGACSAILVTGASAADFDGDNGPCHETPGEQQLLQCPTAFVGVPYEVKIGVEEGSGCEPYYYIVVVNSALPAGLSIVRPGTISGVPTGGPGLARFWLWNHDITEAQGGPSWCQRDDVSQREFSIPVDPGLAINNTTVKPATIGQPYSDTLTAKKVLSVKPVTGSDVQAEWSLLSGVLPPGITLSPTGALSGTPTSEGSYQFTVKALNGSPFDTKTFTLSVRQPVAVTLPFVSASPSAEVGIRFGKSATASGGSGTYTWALTSGALPAGVTLNSSNGALAGIPRTAGRFALALTATDAEGRATTANGVLAVAPKLAIKTLRLKAATFGTAYRSQLATAGGVRPLKWKLSGKLPRGLHFAKSLGALVGTPRRTGTFRVSVEARDALGAKAKRTLVLLVTS
jgi:hypothetical protein